MRIWKNLAGEVRNHVTLNNVRIFLLAVMGTFTEPGLPKGEQNLSKVEDDSILNMVLEQINHSSEGRYSDYLEYKEHENENIFSYLLWVIFRFFQIKLGIFFQDDRYTSPLLERTYVLEQTKKCLTPH